MTDTVLLREVGLGRQPLLQGIPNPKGWVILFDAVFISLCPLCWYHQYLLRHLTDRGWPLQLEHGVAIPAIFAAGAVQAARV